jgi:hypothetical protein
MRSAFVIDLIRSTRVGGVNPRAIIGGQMYRVGDIVDAQRVIRIVKIEADSRSVEFADEENNTLTRTLD